MSHEVSFHQKINEQDAFYLGTAYGFRILITLRSFYEDIKDYLKEDPILILLQLKKHNSLEILEQINSDLTQLKFYYSESYPKLQIISQELNHWQSKMNNKTKNEI